MLVANLHLTCNSTLNPKLTSSGQAIAKVGLKFKGESRALTILRNPVPHTVTEQ